LYTKLYLLSYLCSDFPFRTPAELTWAVPDFTSYRNQKISPSTESPSTESTFSACEHRL
jgi:hypothetical protein